MNYRPPYYTTDVVDKTARLIAVYVLLRKMINGRCVMSNEINLPNLGYLIQ